MTAAALLVVLCGSVIGAGVVRILRTWSVLCDRQRLVRSIQATRSTWGDCQ